MKSLKRLAYFACLFAMLLSTIAYVIFYERTEEIIVIENDHFSMTQNKNFKEEYFICFNNPISVTDIMSSIKQAVSFCSIKKKNNSYFIGYKTEETEKLNQLFLKKLNTDNEHLSQIEIDELNLKIGSMYDIFLRKLLFDAGCHLPDSAFITTPDMLCGLNDEGNLCLYGEVYIYFNWQNITGSSVSESIHNAVHNE